MIQACHTDVVALTVQQNLGHDEQRQPLGAVRQGAVVQRDLGQHQMDDVVADVLIAARNPHLVARQPIAGAQLVFAVGHGARAHVRKVRAGLRLRQAHGAEPPARDLGQGEGLGLSWRAELGDQASVGCRQHRIGRRGDIGGGEEGERRRTGQIGQAQSAQFLAEARREQAKLGVLLQSGPDRGQGDHPPILQPRLSRIGRLVMRQEQIDGEVFRQVQHRVDALAAVIGEGGRLEQRLHLQPVVQHEIQVATDNQGMAHAFRAPRLRSLSAKSTSRAAGSQAHPCR